MKPAYTAALALVGWYLMVPRFACPDHKCPADAGAPLYQWHRSFITFKSRVDCEHARAKAIALIDKPVAGGLWTFEDKKRATEALCIAGDDPRLKAN